MADLREINEILDMMAKDGAISKNIRDVLAAILEELKDEKNVPVKIDAALQKIEDLSLDPNLSPYVRTQIWNLTSLLETAQNA
ncbi:MAG: UPF0147 family protein [archaeon]